MHTVLTLLAITAGAVYLVLRANTLGGGWLLALSVPLYLAELLAYAQFSLFVFVAWHARHNVADTANGPSRRRERVRPTLTDLVVSVGGHTVEALERTLVGARNVHAAGVIFVVDDEHRDDAAEVTAALGARYLVDSRPEHRWVDVMFEITSSDHVGWLTAGDVPMPDYVEAASSRLSDSKVGVWQSAIGLFNSDSFTHVQRGRDEDAVVRSIVGPGLDLFGAAPWNGSGSVLRRSAFEAAAPLEGSVQTAERLAALHQAGWTSATDRDAHVRTIAPDNLDDYLLARQARARNAFALLRGRPSPLLRRGLSLLQRVSYLTIVSLFVTGIRQVVVVAVLVATLVSGRLPFDGPLGTILLFWAMATASATMARRHLADDSMRIGDWTKHGWRTVGADLAALRSLMWSADRQETRQSSEATGLRTLGRLRAVTLSVVALDLALLLRGTTIVFESALPAFTTSERLLAVSFGVFALVPMVDVLHLVVARRQRRKNFRLDADLDIRIGDTEARTLDLSTSGVGVLLPFAPLLDSEVELRLDLPDASGTLDAVDLRGVVRAANRDDSGLVRVGIEFLDPTPRARQSLIRFCMSGTDRSDRLDEVAEPRDLTIERPDAHRVHSVRALTAVASAASLALLFLGPSSASASTAPVETFTVRLLDSEGGGVSGAEVRTFLDDDQRWQQLGDTAPDGSTTFDATIDVIERANASIDLQWNGARLVLPLRGVDTTVFASRIEVGDAAVDAIDTGSGWQTLDRSTDVLPGQIAIRLVDGSVLKVELEPGNAYDVARGEQGPLTPPTTAPQDPPTSTSSSSTEPSTTTTAVSPTTTTASNTTTSNTTTSSTTTAPTTTSSSTTAVSPTTTAPPTDSTTTVPTTTAEESGDDG